MDESVPHILGLELVRQIECFTTESLESFEEHFTWLDEILETAKTAFQTAQIQTLPKTPSAKKRRGRKRKSEVPSFIRRSSVFPKAVDQSLDESHDAGSYGTRATRALRSRKKADTSMDLSVDNTSIGRATRNTRNNSARKNIITEPELSPTKEISESPVKTKPVAKPPRMNPPKDATQEKVDVGEYVMEDVETKNDVTEESTPADAEKTLPSETTSPAKPAISPAVSSMMSASESRVVNNSSFVVETLSEEKSNLNLPVISSPLVVKDAGDKPEAMDTDSGVNSDDKEQDNEPEDIAAVPSEAVSKASDEKAISDADTEQDTGKPSSSALSSEEVTEPPRTRTRTRKQQQPAEQTLQLPAPVPKKDSVSSTTSAELNEAPPRMTRSRMRTKPAATTEPVLVPVPAKSTSEPSENAKDEDEPEVLPRTRTRTLKRQSCEMEGKKDSEMKRQCIQAEESAPMEKRRSSRLSAKQSAATAESPEDADAEDSPDEADATADESWMTPDNYRTPSNLASSRSFLRTMNNSYMSANRTPSQKTYNLYKYTQQNGSFTGSAQKNGTQSRMNILGNISCNFKSLLLKKNATPSKGTPKVNQHFLDQRKREFEEKRRKEQERLMKREELQKMKLEERKKKREDRMRKVQESRHLKEIQEKELKEKKNKKMEEKFSHTDRIREEKLREEREKLRLRMKKQQEAEERRNQEDEERVKKLKEQEEEHARHQAMLQRKKEYEEQERQKKLAEEKRKLDYQRERILEAEREKQNELERRKRIEEEREQERQKLREEREKEVARIRAEKLELIKEKQREAEEIQKQKLRELAKERLAYEQQMAEKKQQREQYIANVLHQPSSVISPAVAPSSLSSSYQKEVARPTGHTLNTSYKITSNPDSYPITPARSSYNNYDIDGLKSDDSTDEEEGPRKPVPEWACGKQLKISLITQYYNPPNLDLIFAAIEPPDLNDFFIKKKSRFNRRTSSAVWDSPILKSHIPVLN